MRSALEKSSRTPPLSSRRKRSRSREVESRRRSRSRSSERKKRRKRSRSHDKSSQRSPSYELSGKRVKRSSTRSKSNTPISNIDNGASNPMSAVMEAAARINAIIGMKQQAGEKLKSGGGFAKQLLAKSEVNVKTQIEQESKEQARKRRRKSRWSTAKSFVSGMPTILPSDIDETQRQCYLLHMEIEESTRKLRQGDYLQSNEAERSPSPEPIYDANGKRLNTRKIRKRQELEQQRHEKILKLNPEYKPPADYRWECPDPPNVTASIICTACGGSGHIAKDSKTPRPRFQFDGAGMDDEYSAFMADLGEKPSGGAFGGINNTTSFNSSTSGFNKPYQPRFHMPGGNPIIRVNLSKPNPIRPAELLHWGRPNEAPPPFFSAPPQQNPYGNPPGYPPNVAGHAPSMWSPMQHQHHQWPPTFQPQQHQSRPKLVPPIVPLPRPLPAVVNNGNDSSNLRAFLELSFPPLGPPVVYDEVRYLLDADAFLSQQKFPLAHEMVFGAGVTALKRMTYIVNFGLHCHSALREANRLLVNLAKKLKLSKHATVIFLGWKYFELCHNFFFESLLYDNVGREERVIPYITVLRELSRDQEFLQAFKESLIKSTKGFYARKVDTTLVKFCGDLFTEHYELTPQR